MTYPRYVPASEGFIPDDALIVGHESNNSNLYGIRAEHNGCIIPGKISSGCIHAVVGEDSLEYYKTNYEVLCIDSNNVEWVSAFCGRVPLNAIPVGRHCNGEILYMGRAHYEGALIAGKIQRSSGFLLITHNQLEIPITNYEVLSLKNPSASRSQTPSLTSVRAIRTAGR